MTEILGSISFLETHSKYIPEFSKKGEQLFKQNKNWNLLHTIFICNYTNIDIFAILYCINQNKLDKEFHLESKLTNSTRNSLIYKTLMTKEVQIKIRNNSPVFFHNDLNMVSTFVLTYLIYLQQCNSALLNLIDENTIILAFNHYLDAKKQSYNVFKYLYKFQENRETPASLLNNLAFSKSQEEEGSPQQIENLKEYLKILKRGDIEKCSVF